MAKNTADDHGDRPCGKHCWDAECFDCDCICQGRNHGAGEACYRQQYSLFESLNTIPFNEFYKNEDRASSHEVSFGDAWLDGRKMLYYHVRWIAITGELYVTDYSEKRVEILGVFRSMEELKERIKGWESKCGNINSLGWIRRKCNV